MSEGTGANPDSARSKGDIAEEIAEQMVGLDQDFEEIVTDTSNIAGEEEVQDGYKSFLKSGILGKMAALSERGLTAANNIKSGAAKAAENDYESGDNYRVAPQGLRRNPNVP